ncbi:MAG: DinB family protein [Chitinophagaceae bacterium]
MRKFLLFVSAVVMLSFVSADNTLSKKERKMATKHLKDTQKDVINAMKGLSDAQLKFKPAPDRWSVEECLKHIAITEGSIWQMTEGFIKQAANPDKRAEIKSTDEQVIQMISSRNQKAQAQESVKPENTPYKSADEALQAFKASRAKLIDYVKSTNEDLRNHVAALPFGHFDTYQLILFIGAHSNRHMQQMEEVKADPGFPKN